MKNYKFKENEVIHCETEEQAKAVLKMAHEQGFKWCSGADFLEENNWQDYNSETCYDINLGEYGRKYSYKIQGFEIIKAKDIIMESNNYMKTREEVIEYFKNAKKVRCAKSVDEGYPELDKIEASSKGWLQNPHKENWLILWDKYKGWAGILENKESNKEKAKRLRMELQEVEYAIKKENEFKVGDIVVIKDECLLEFLDYTSGAKKITSKANCFDWNLNGLCCVDSKNIRKATLAEIEEYNRPKFNIGDLIVKEWESGSRDMFPLERIRGSDLFGNPFLSDMHLIINNEHPSAVLESKEYTLRTATKKESEHFHARVKELCKPKLPVINGYQGVDESGYIKYGCKRLLKTDLRIMFSLDITSFNLMVNDEKVKVSKAQVKALREYLK